MRLLSIFDKLKLEKGKQMPLSHLVEEIEIKLNLCLKLIFVK